MFSLQIHCLHSGCQWKNELTPKEENMPVKQPPKRSSAKENTKSSQPTRKSKKADYLQFTEA